MHFWLTCLSCSSKYPIELLIGTCKCGGICFVEYDLEKIGHRLDKRSFYQRKSNIWRYFELLPIKSRQSIVSLGEGMTPLIRMENLEKKLSINNLWVKREEQNPSGSFKARGSSVSISLLKEHGIKKVAVSSNGNAAASLSAYAGYADMEAYVFLPKDSPNMIIEECNNYGAHIFLVDGLIHDAGKIIEEGEKEQGWFNASTFKEPGRVEGKKTMGYELLEQLNWKFPSVIIYPVGGGSGILGLWKAFSEFHQLGFTIGEFPRIVCVQQEGCSPIVDALQNNLSNILTPDSSIVTNSTGMRVPNPIAGNFVLNILKKNKGIGISVTKEEILSAKKIMGRNGISSSPEGAASFAGLLHLLENQLIDKNDSVVLFNTSHAVKYTSPQLLDIRVIKNYSDFALTSSFH
jgi:threonine synthase